MSLNRIKSNDQRRELCLKLLHAETENEAIQILKQYDNNSNVHKYSKGTVDICAGRYCAFTPICILFESVKLFPE